MRSRSYLLAALLLSTACASEPLETVRNTGARDYGGDLGIGSGVAKPVTIGTISAPQDGTYFDLIAPPVPAGATIHPLKARLTGGGGTFTLTTIHVNNGTWTGTPVPAGTYTLTYLDEADNLTALQEAVTVTDGMANYKIISGIMVDPASAVATDRTGVQALAYEIVAGNNYLKTTKADLGVIIDLPSGDTTWTPMGVSGDRGLPLSLSAVESLVSVAWGSIQVKFRAGQTLVMQDSQDALLFGPLESGVEYLLPALPQTQGCRVYEILVGYGAPYTRTLCSDATAHILFNLP